MYGGKKKYELMDILVSGGSIAGPTLAYWLNRYGFKVTLVERASELRLGGQNIDVKGPALEVVRKMGLEDKIRAANTTEVGLRFVNHVALRKKRTNGKRISIDLQERITPI